MGALTAVAGPTRAVGTGTWLMARAIRATARQMMAREPLAEHYLGPTIGDFLWRPLPRLMLLSTLVGMIAGIAAVRVLTGWSAQTLVLGVLVDAMLRQILPLIAGVFASGSLSVQLAARLGAMALSREIDALETMGHDPVDHALAAPVTAVLVAGPVHMIAAALAAVVGAGLPLHLSATVAWRVLSAATFAPTAASALLTGMAKVLVFSVIAPGVGATVGAGTVLVPADLGRHAGFAFSAGLLGIFAAGALWSALA